MGIFYELSYISRAGTHYTGTHIIQKFLILEHLSSGNQLVSSIQIRSSYSSLILVNNIFQLNSIVCDLPKFQCFPASLTQANFAFVFFFFFSFSPSW